GRGRVGDAVPGDRQPEHHHDGDRREVLRHAQGGQPLITPGGGRDARHLLPRGPLLPRPGGVLVHVRRKTRAAPAGGAIVVGVAGRSVHFATIAPSHRPPAAYHDQGQAVLDHRS